MNGQLKLAVFDCDGTLVDSVRSIVAALHTTCDAFQVAKPDAQAVRRVIGLPLIDAIARLMPEHSPQAHAEMTDAYKTAFAGMRQNGTVDEPLYPGVLDALNALDEMDWLLGVATGKAMRGLVATLGTHDLAKHFVTLQTPDHSPGKPHPGMMLRAMRETGADARATVMIGDTTYDMEMARNAGAHAVGVAWGYHEVAELTQAGAHRVVHSFSELPDTLEQMMKDAG